MGFGRRFTGSAAFAATVAAGAMIAQQVGGKAARDAIFLSHFDVTSLPYMVMIAAVISILVVLGTAKAMTAYGPARLMPGGFALSSGFLLVEWALLLAQPRAGAVAIYLHMAVFSAILISGFWSLITERFDPRTARKSMSRIAGGATLGGLVGGLLAERVGTMFSVSATLPLMALLHLVCAGLVLRIRGPMTGTVDAAPEPEGPTRSGFQVLRQVSYLRNLALLVALGTVSAGLIDYVFKAEAAAAFADEQKLIRFFALFYTGMGLLTFLVQSSLSRVFLEKLGLGRTVGTLPLAVTGGSLLALVIPGLGAATGMRGAESVMRSSLFRSGYELLYTPIRAREKRATKTIVDVGFDRLGDAVGAGLVKLLLLLGPVLARPVILMVAVALGLVALLATRWLQRGYIRALEWNLLNRAETLPRDPALVTGNQLFQTMSSLGIHSDIMNTMSGSLDLSGAGTLGPVATSPTTNAEADSTKAPPPPDPLMARMADLRSGDPGRVRAALRGGGLDPSLVPQAIQLLAWDELTTDAARALVRLGPRIFGQLGDALADPDQEFAVRRRIPPVLAAKPHEAAVEPLLAGLRDRRFEVRFRCGRALARLSKAGIPVHASEPEILLAVKLEVRVDRRVWEGKRLLDKLDDDADSFFVDEVLRDRANRTLEHVFTVLALVLPREPLQVAYRGLHTEDRALRGTALEYLESVLPVSVRVPLWPFLEGTRIPQAGERRSREQIVADLLRSNESIQINLEVLREQYRDREDAGG